jgi:UDPglucose 6-dehydrogenase
VREKSETDQHVVIVGAGVVGVASGLALHDIGRRVSFVEVDPQQRSVVEPLGLRVSDSFVSLASDTIVMVCVQTPAGPVGFDLEALERAIRAIGSAMGDNTEGIIVAIRSTVPPGTCEQVEQWLHEATHRTVGDGYDVVCMPEFLRQATALDDARHPRVTVIASPSPQAVDTMVELVRPLGGSVHTSQVFADAEMIKCAHNAYNAAKISFWNEMHSFAEHFGADSLVMGRIVAESAEASWNPTYGIRGGRPYEGSCLPKDVAGFAAHASAAGLDPVVLAAVDERNTMMRFITVD